MLYARHMFTPLQNSDRHLSVRLPVLLKTIATGAITLISLYAILNTAYATEDTARGSTATTIPHPELAPMGIRRGSFTLFPNLIYSLNFVDNVFATESNTESSYVSEIIPSISANSDWNNHALNFRATVIDSTNNKFSSEDYTDWNLEADGIIDISRDTLLSLGAATGLQHIARSAPDDARGVEPTEFDRTSFFTRYSHRSGRLVSAINLNLVRKEYQDVDAIRLGIPVTLDTSDRDRTESRLRLRTGFRYVGDEQVFFSLEGFDRNYDTTRNFSGLDQSSTGLEALVGASFDYHGIVLGEFAVGYRTQDYQQPLEDIHRPIIETSIRWNVTDLSTISFIVDHQVQESIDLVFSGYTSTSASVTLDHELRRNLLLDLSLQFTRNEYIGIDLADRNDDIYNIGAGFTYKMNRNLFFNSQFVHEERKSDFNTVLGDPERFDFNRNLISFQLQAQF